MPPIVGHVIDEFLRLSETFIYSQLRTQSTEGATVLARRRVNRELFPFGSVHELDSRSEGRLEAALRRRVLRVLPLSSKFEKGIERAALAEGCDLLHAHFGWHGCHALPASSRLGLPLLTSFYGRDVYSPGFGRGSANSMFGALFTAGSRFTCVGSNARDQLIREGCPKERVQILKLGVNLEDFPYCPRPAQRPLIILQIARFTEKKGIDVTLRAYALARAHLGASELWVIGDGGLRSSLVTLAQSLAISDDVRFLGALQHGDVQECVARAHIGVQPSRTADDGDKEGSPTVLLEMQAAGLPVVATCHADIPSIVARPEELLRENDARGLANALIELAGLSDSERGERAEAGRALVEREHDHRKIGRQLRAIYHDMAGNVPLEIGR